jgi:hypothetical protein
MKRAFAIVLAAVLLSSCVAVTVERRRPRKGPVKEVGYVDYGGGQVRYSTEGWSWAVASRRKTALKLMSRNCGSELVPEITDEYSRQDADAAYNGEDIDASMKIGDEHFKIERYIHLAYECRPKGSPLPAVSTMTAHGPSLVIPAVLASTSAAVVELSTAAVALSTSAAFAAPPSSSPAVVPISSAAIPAPELPR